MTGSLARLVRDGAGADSGPAPDLLDVETRLVAIARSEAPLRCALASVVGRLVATKAWERLGFARIGDYGRERAGVSGRQLYELAHMHGVFSDVPRLRRAFLEGRASWSQACLLARVVTPDNIEQWLALAGSLSAHALAREVREVDESARASQTLAAADDGSPRQSLRLTLTAAARAKWSRARLLASQTAGQRVAPAEVAEAVVAEVLSAGAVDPEVCNAATERTDVMTGPECPELDEIGTAPWHRPAPESLGEMPLRPPAQWIGAVSRSPFVSGLTDGLEAADPFELDTRLRRALRLEQQHQARLGPLLAEVAQARLYRRLGFARLGAFVVEWLGMSERKAQVLLRLERACAVCPALQAAWRGGCLSWVQANALVPLVTCEDGAGFAEAWVAHAESVTVRQLDQDVERALAHGLFDPQTSAQPRGSDSKLPRAATTSFTIAGVPGDVARLFRSALATVQRRIERRTDRPSSESEAFEAMLEHALDTWGARSGKIPREHRVFERDGWRCMVPGCTSYRNLHAHHVRFRSRGGSDALSNLATLCAWHHLRGVHVGSVRVTGRAPEGLRFELGVRAEGPPLAVYLSGDRSVADESCANRSAR